MAPAFALSTTLRVSLFTPSPASACATHATPNVAVVPRRASPSMRSKENLDKKIQKVSAVSEALSNSTLLFASPLDGLTVAQVRALKNNMPNSTTVMTVKNTLMRRAVADTVWEPASSMTKQSTMWFFVGEEIKASVDAYNAYMKEISRDAPIRGGVFEGEEYDKDGIEAVAKLPTKEELITKIAFSIRAIPTKVAKSVKAVPTKVGRAIKLAVAEEGEGGDAAGSE